MKTRISHLTSLFILFLAISMISCEPDPEIFDTVPFVDDCEFVQDDTTNDGLIDPTERSIMDQCISNSFTNEEDIIANLEGAWELIGHGEGWVPTISQPCSHLIFTADEVIFDFDSGFSEYSSTHTWSVEKVLTPSWEFFRLKFEPNLPVGLGITKFCENYMYGDATPLDGNMYLYEKIE